MALTVTQKNSLRLLKQSLDRVISKRVARCKKLAIHKDKEWKNATCLTTVDTLFADLAAQAHPPTHLSDMDDHLMLLRAVLDAAYTSDRNKRKLETEFLRDLWKHATEYAMLSQMPMPKRDYVRRGKRTLVERRADVVDEKIREWQRKLTLAKNKLATYRKKQKYYTKKGVAHA
jgi:hypothetical protein